ncbi:MAG: Na+/H+ antiporter subunit B [Anaerolineae bacterium]|nr:Na+/H+ antiporter subunit B [Anaerolineae bacterium]
MNSLILRATIRLMFPVLLLFSLFMLFRGHNAPGGGFIGGLVAAAAILTQLLAVGPEQIRQSFPFTFRHLLPIGLLTAIAAGLLGILQGKAFLTGVWVIFTLLGVGEVKIGSPLLFDIGVYLVVIGMTVEIIVTMAEEESWKLF